MAATTHRINCAGLTIIGIALFCALIAGTQYHRLYPRDTLPAFPYGEIRIAVDPSYTPFAFYTDDGLAGFDIALGNALGEYFNLPVRFIPVSIDGLYDTLISDQADIIVSALVIDTWRLHEVRYTQSYFDAGLVLVSPKDAPIMRMEDLPGYVLAFAFGSIADSEAQQWQRRIGVFETRPYELPEYALDAVRVGTAHAALVDVVDARLYLNQHPNWPAQFNYVTRLPYVIGVQMAQKQTFDALRKALTQMAQQGILDLLVNRWF